MELYKIWATFDLKGNALKQMREFSSATKIANQDIKKFTKNLQGISPLLISMNKELSQLNPKFRSLSSSFGKVSIGAGDARSKMSAFSASLYLAKSRTEGLEKQTRGLARNLSIIAEKGVLASDSLAGMGGIGGIGGGAGRGAGRGRGRGHRGSLSHGFLHGIGMAGLGYFSPPAMAAMGVGATLVSSYRTGSEYQRLMGQLTALNYTPDELKQVDKFASSTHLKGVSQLDMLQAYIDAQMATRQTPSMASGALATSEVKQFAPILAKSKFAANVLYGGMGDQQEQNLIRFAEIMGGSSVKRRMQYLDAAMQMMVSSGGSIMPTELRTFGRQAGGAFSNLSPEALVGMEPVFQESGGAKLATGLVTGLRQLITGTGSNFNKKQINFLEKMGVLTATYDNQGRPLGVHMPDKYARIAGTDPFKFMTDVIIPGFKKAGVNTNDPTALSNAFTLAFSRTYSNQLQIMNKNQQSIQRQLDQLHGIGGVNTQYEMSTQLLGAAPKILGAAWSDFAKAISDLTSPSISKGLLMLAGALERVAMVIHSVTNTSIKDIAGRAAEGIPKTHFWGGIKNLVKGGSISEAPNKKPSPAVINLHMDSRKVAQAIVPDLSNMMTQGGVIPGTSSTNIGLNPTSINYNGAGAF